MTTISLTDPIVILAGIKQFGLASDGSDLRDLAAAIDRMRAALKPFADAVYNDNGDVTLSTGHITTGDYMRAQRVLRGTQQQGSEK